MHFTWNNGALWLHLRTSQTNKLTGKFTVVAGSQRDRLCAAVLRAPSARAAAAVGAACASPGPWGSALLSVHGLPPPAHSAEGCSLGP